MRVDPDAPNLPVIGQGALAGVRRSTRGRWRAAVLVALHLAIAAHAAHYLVAGRTLSPVEPSESMYTLELGWVNAGFLFFGAAILSTLVFGRFVCGWGCHVIALQDLCAWIMKKMGVRPRPFRSRLLVYGPLALALYMFAWPTFRRLVLDVPATPFPGFTNRLMTTEFWATFPGPVFAVLTLLTAGFAAVYVLGAKGFCTYGCPYGAFFAVADRLAPAGIVVNDDCNQCGHCTVTCTSNVRVHEEVRDYGRVVDPGCMKCTDCVSVCPNGALRFAWTKPAILTPARTPPRKRAFDLSLGDELLVGGVALGATLAFRGLYDGPPLLMAIGLGAMTGYGALRLRRWRWERRRPFKIQDLTPCFLLLWIAFTVHSGVVQWHRARGRVWLERTEASRTDVMSGAFRGKTYSEAHRRAAAETLRHFGLADRWGLVGVVEVKLGLAWAHLLRDDFGEGVRALRGALALAPDRPELWDDLHQTLLARGLHGDAADALRRKMSLGPATVEERFRAGTLFAQAGRLDEAAAELALVVAAEPGSAPARYNLGGVLRRLGRTEAAIDELAAAVRLAPGDADAAVELGLACREGGRPGDAIRAFRRAIELRPDSPESRVHLPALIAELEAAARSPVPRPR